MPLRQHQAEFEDTISQIESGKLETDELFVHATPGAGKSTIPIQACRLIKAGLADRIAWVVPRLTLGYQAESNFLDPFFREMFNHNYCIRTATNEYNPCRGTNGFVTTYQAIGVDDELTVLREFDEHRYILIGDEWHHCELNGTWHNKLKHIVDKAAFKIWMTGTLSRGDDKRIAFTPYERFAKNRYEPDFSDHTLIRYTRSQALKEKAILQSKFFLFDGNIEYQNKKGKLIKGRLSEQYYNSSEAIYTALNTKFAEDLLNEGLRHWVNYKKDHPRSKFMVVCSDITHAKQINKMLDRMGFHSKVATSDDSNALVILKEFKNERLDILSSVAMCYEGFDCKPLTHVVFLTNIRSVPWIEQVIARPVRIDPEAGPYESQNAFIWAPDDPLFHNVVEQIKSEQVLAAKDNGPGEARERGEKGHGSSVPGIEAINGEIIGSREVSIGQIPSGYIVPLTVSEQEKDLRTKIEKHVNTFCFQNRYKPQKINTEIKTHFRKARDLMELSELKECLKYVKEYYPLNGEKNNIKGVSQVRGRRRRVPTKAVPWP